MWLYNIVIKLFHKTFLCQTVNCNIVISDQIWRVGVPFKKYNICTALSTISSLKRARRSKDLFIRKIHVGNLKSWFFGLKQYFCWLEKRYHEFGILMPSSPYLVSWSWYIWRSPTQKKKCLRGRNFLSDQMRLF